MSLRNFVLILVLFFSLSACTNNEKEKKVEQPTKDSTEISEKLPPIETEFPDTVIAAPVKDSALLKFNFQKGKVYNYNMSFDVTQTKGEKKASTLMKWNYDMEVVDLKKDVRTIKTTYKKIEMVMDMGEQKMEFSSEKEVDAMDFMQLPSKMFKIVKGKSFMMEVNDKGEIVSVTGFDKIGDAVVAEMNLPAEMKPIMQERFKKQFSDENVKEMFAQWFSVYPNKYVTVGDTWKRTTAITGFQQKATTVYTVKNIKGNRVYVSGASKITGDGNNGSIASKIIIDARTGLMIDGVFDQKSSGAKTSTTKSRITGKEL
jgi:hypothetical protein